MQEFGSRVFPHLQWPHPFRPRTRSQVSLTGKFLPCDTRTLLGVHLQFLLSCCEELGYCGNVSMTVTRHHGHRVCLPSHSSSPSLVHDRGPSLVLLTLLYKPPIV